jgi:probable rRNA maturation factor
VCAGLSGREENLIVFRKQVVGMNEQALARFVVRARNAIKLRGTVTVLITGNAEMKKLNLCFRNKNKATDVLSFTAALYPNNDIAGDVAISVEIARENAKNLGHAVSDEIKILILHGILHLAGYDHETDQGEMAAKEHRLRKVLRLPVTLIERNEAVPQRSHKKRKKTLKKEKRTAAVAGKTLLLSRRAKQGTGKKRRS